MSIADKSSEPQELAHFVLEHFYVPDDTITAPFDQAAEGLTGQFSLTALVFRTNLHSAILAASIPYTMATVSVTRRRFDAFYSAERIRALKNVEPNQPLTRGLEEEAYQIACSRMDQFRDSEQGTIWFRDAILHELSAAGKQSDFKIAAEELLFGTLVNSWGTFEAFMSEMFRLLLNAKPTLSARLLSDESTKKHFPARIVSVDAIAMRDFNIAACMGDLLLEHRHLDRDVFGVLFPNQSNLRLELGNSDLWMLSKKRHLIVHKRGIVDASYLATTSDTTAPGTRLRITGDYVHRSLVLVRDVAAEVARAIKLEFADLI